MRTWRQWSGNEEARAKGGEGGGVKQWGKEWGGVRQWGYGAVTTASIESLPIVTRHTSIATINVSAPSYLPPHVDCRVSPSPTLAVVLVGCCVYFCFNDKFLDHASPPMGTKTPTISLATAAALAFLTTLMWWLVVVFISSLDNASPPMGATPPPLSLSLFVSPQSARVVFQQTVVPHHLIVVFFMLFVAGHSTSPLPLSLLLSVTLGDHGIGIGQRCVAPVPSIPAPAHRHSLPSLSDRLKPWPS